MPLLSEENRRKRNLVIIAAFLLLIGGATAFDLGIFAPELPVASNIVIFALFNLNLIVLLLLILLLFRNLVKVWLERRQNAIGSRFRATVQPLFAEPPPPEVHRPRGSSAGPSPSPSIP